MSEHNEQPRIVTGEDRARAEMSLIAGGGVLAGMIALAPLMLMMKIPSCGSDIVAGIFMTIGGVITIPWAICTSIIWGPIAYYTYRFAKR